MAKLVGRLGNHMWIYASLYAIGRKSGRKPIACGHDILHTLFNNLTAVQISPHKICQKIKRLDSSNIMNIKEVNNRYYDVGMISRLSKENHRHAFISAYFQSFGYFVEYANDIKKQYIIKKRYQDFAQRYMHNILTRQRLFENKHINNLTEQDQWKTPPVFVSVHVRRGDMVKFHEPLPPPSYFENALGYFRKKHLRNVIFIVVTDTPKWSESHLKGDDLYFTYDSGYKTLQQDFAIAVACNHTVMSVGTFGWWMGFLGDGEVVYWKDFVKKLNSTFFLEGQYFPDNFKGVGG